MINVSTDGMAIYFLLEEAEMLFSDFEINHVIAFEKEENFNLVVYDALNKKFIAFFVNVHCDTSILNELLNLIQDNQEFPSGLQKKAIQLIEDKINSENNFRLFFDAH
jgi:hypothetical protein